LLTIATVPQKYYNHTRHDKADVDQLGSDKFAHGLINILLL
jgi:hypothetical protein